MNILIVLFASLCLFHLLVVLAKFRFIFSLSPGGIQLLSVYLNHRVNDDLFIYFGYAVFDIVRWGLTKADGRMEFQVLLTFSDKNASAQEKTGNRKQEQSVCKEEEL